MRKLLTGLLIGMMLLLPLATVQALGSNESGVVALQQSDSGSVRVIPPEGEQGTTHTIFVGGLQNEELVSIQIIEDSTNSTVYTTDRAADNNGRLEMEIFTTDDDAPGRYRVEVLNRSGDVITTANLTILDPPGLDGVVGITPDKADAGSEFSIAVSNVRPFADIAIEIRNEQGSVVQTIRARANVDGEVTVDFHSHNSDGGTYTAAVLDDGVEVASDVFIVDGPIFTVSTSVITPVNVGDDIVVSIIGLDANTDFTAHLRAHDILAESIDGTADANGSAIVIFAGDDTFIAGGYLVEVTQDTELVSRTAFQVEGDAVVADTDTDNGIDISIDPASGITGTTHTITVTGLEPRETIDLDVLLDGASVYSTPRSADGDGVVTLNLTSEEGDELGVYSVEITREGELVASADFEVVSEAVETPPTTEDITITIEPERGNIGTAYTVTVSGLEAETGYTLEVVFDGNAVYTTERTADAEGQITLNLASEDGDEFGIYTVNVVSADTVVASADFEIASATVETPRTTITIEPESGAIGTAHTITVDGLDANETVTLDVLFDGAVVYSTDRTADANGQIILNLASEDGDEAGTYSVTVNRDDTQLASADFVVESASTTPPAQRDVTISIDPPSAPIGETFTIDIAGLDADETVTVSIIQNGDVAFSTERTADANGTIQMLIAGDEGDELGDYQVVVESDGVVLAEGSMALEDTETVTPPDTDSTVTVTVDPASGAIPTTHEVTITGLDPRESVTLEVLLDGSSIFSTTAVADGEGVATVILTSEEGDESGEYTIHVLRAGELLASDTMTITGEDVVTTPPEQTTDNTSETAGQMIDDRLTLGEPSHRINFSGQAGDAVIISLNSPDFDTYLILEDNSGMELNRNDDSNGTLNSQIGPYTLPYSGEYTVVVSSYSFISFSEPIVGNYQLLIEVVGMTAISYGEPVSLELTSENFSQFLTFDGAAGDVISVSVDSGGTIDTELSIITPDGYTDFVDDDGGAGFDPEVVRYVLPINGTYTLTIRAFSPGDEGTVDVLVERYDQRTLDDDSRVIRLNRKFTSDILTLEGRAGEAVQLDLVVLDGSVGDLTISVMQNDYSLMYYQAAGIPDSLTLGFVVPEDGSVTIRVEDYTGSSSELRFSIGSRQSR